MATTSKLYSSILLKTQPNSGEEIQKISVSLKSLKENLSNGISLLSKNM
jgi:hypothetical protein